MVLLVSVATTTITTEIQTGVDSTWTMIVASRCVTEKRDSVVGIRWTVKEGTTATTIIEIRIRDGDLRTWIEDVIHHRIWTMVMAPKVATDQPEDVAKSEGLIHISTDLVPLTEEAVDTI